MKKMQSGPTVSFGTERGRLSRLLIRVMAISGVLTSFAFVALQPGDKPAKHESVFRQDCGAHTNIRPAAVQKCAADSGVRVVTGEYESTLMVGDAIVRCGCGY